MLKLIKLYSEDSAFKELNFKSGVNLICGEKSLSDDGSIESDKQNGVGKSLSIELINFCLLKKEIESRVRDIPDEHLAKESFIYLHFNLNGKDFIIGRNKKNQVKIKVDSNPYQEYEVEDAKKELTRFLKFEDDLLSARDYFNFIIKEEDYTFKDFVKLYTSNYSDLLKIHFYFFGFPLKTLADIKNAFKRSTDATNQIRSIKNDLEGKDLNIEEIKAISNQIKSEIESAEKQLSYGDLTETIKVESELMSLKESEINDLILIRKTLKLQLSEINDFARNYNEDFYIDDAEIGKVFDKFKNGLGDLIRKDIGELKAFRNQILEFKDQLLKEKRKSLTEEVKRIDSKIESIKQIIEVKYQNVTAKKSSNFSKGLNIYKQKYSDLQRYSTYIEEYEKQEKKKDLSRKSFNEEIDLLKEIEEKIVQIKKSYETTFIKIHKEIMGNSQSSFDFVLRPIFMPESFFAFNISIHGQGSKGVNQMRAVIYDLALLLNEHTSKRHLKLLIHDNLIFGSVDKSSSINTLNFLSRLNQGEFQYIATVNKDDFSYSELESKFNFDTKDKVIIELTKSDPLFHNWV